MALADSRVVLKQGSTLTDLSANLSDLFASPETLPIVASSDQLFFGSDVPFNHRFLMIETPNSQTAAISAIDVWNGSAWVPCVDIIDRTKDGGKTFAKSGVLEWTPDRSSYWNKAASTEDIPSLVTLKIYNKYWARVSFSADLLPGTQLKYVGQRFSSDSDLSAYYPDVMRSSNLDAFQAGKTNWDDQHVLAAEEICVSLKRDFLIWAPGQILDWQRFTNSSTHKVAEIIFRAFGDDFTEERVAAQREFMKSLERTGAGIDREGDGKLSQNEKKPIKRIIRI